MRVDATKPDTDWNNVTNWKNGDEYQGDIRLTKHQKMILDSERSGTIVRSATIQLAKRWPKNWETNEVVIPYTFDAGYTFTQNERKLLLCQSSLLIYLVQLTVCSTAKKNTTIYEIYAMKR